MSPPHRQSDARISEELGIHVITLRNWRKAWRLKGEVMPASEKEPEGWSAADKFMMVLETAVLNTTKLGSQPGARSLPGAGGAMAAGHPRSQRKASADFERAEGAQEAPFPGLARDQGQQEGAEAQGKAMAEMAALLVLRKKWEAFCSEDAEG